MANSRSRYPWIGLLMIVLGGILLLDKLHVVEIGYWMIVWSVVMLFGLVGVARGFARNRRGKIFWGTVWFLYGLFFLLQSSDIFYVRGHMFIPSTFLIIGISFLMVYLNNLHDWVHLVLAVFIGGIGALFILADLEYFSYWDVRDWVHTYWPIALILIGVSLMLRRRSRIDEVSPPSEQNAQGTAT